MSSSRESSLRSIGNQILGGILTSGPVVAAITLTAIHFYKKSKAPKPKPVVVVDQHAAQDVSAPVVESAPFVASGSARLPRKDYKVQQGRVVQEQEVDDADLSGIDGHENEMQMLDEADIDSLQQAGGDDNQKMLKMLQAMGFKVVIPDDGSGQMFLVPPGGDPNNIPKVSDNDEILHRGYLDEREGDDDDGGAAAQMMYDIGEEMGEMGMDEDEMDEGEFLEEGEEFEEEDA